MPLLIFLVCIVGAYLIGSISFAIVSSWVFRLPDPRSYGSGNPGATNVLRSGKRVAALCTLLGDAAKGLIAVLLARQFAPASAFGHATIAASAVAVFAGHLYPLYFRFKGGKGVATAAGILCALSLPLALVSLVVFVVVAALSRYASAASIAAALASVVAGPYFLGLSFELAGVTLIAALIVWRHRVNIERLQAGTESKISLKAR